MSNARLVAALVLGLALAPGPSQAAASSPLTSSPLTWVQPAQTSTAVYEDLTVGAPTTLPWWQHGRLHVDGATIKTRRNDITSRGGTTLVGADVTRHYRLESYWSIVRGRHLRRLPMQAPSRTPFISANGLWLVWLELRAPDTDDYLRIEQYRAVIYDVRARTVVDTFDDRRLVAWEDGDNAVWLHGIDNRGRVLLTRGDRTMVWARGHDVVPLTGTRLPPSQYADGWPRGITLVRKRASIGVFGSVTRSGRFTRSGVVPAAGQGTWSPDGGAYAYSDDGDSSDAEVYHVHHVGTDSIVLLRLPASDVEEYRIVGWESDTSVILWLHLDYVSPLVEPVSRLVRCDALTGSCEQVPDGPGSDTYAAMQTRPS